MVAVNVTRESDAVTRALGRRPGKVVAVHLNYPSRAAQRGRTPAAASYFLKPSSSLSGSGVVEKPRGTELLAFEGEIALVVGARARHVRPEDGWSHVGWVTGANDLGLHDLRTADRGSNVRSKGGDGYTPLGPELLPAAELDPAGLRVRTWLDGELVQDDTSDTLLFDFGHLVADLSRMITLEQGDVILTGTPAGASVAKVGQVIEVEVTDVAGERSTGRLRTEVVEGPELAPWGSPAFVDDAVRADAWGTQPEAPAGLDSDLRDRLGRVAVATLSSQLRKRGFDDVSIDGVHPLVPGRPMVGTARTLRFVPFRPDLFQQHGGGYNAQKRAFDSAGTRRGPRHRRPARPDSRHARRHPGAARQGPRRRRDRHRRRGPRRRGGRRARPARLHLGAASRGSRTPARAVGDRRDRSPAAAPPSSPATSSSATTTA